jgi:hypothetical protein
VKFLKQENKREETEEERKLKIHKKKKALIKAPKHWLEQNNN